MQKKINNSLTPEQEKVMFEGGTEAPFSGKLLNNKKKGSYVCANCGHILFSSDSKFDSGTGWPSFDTPENIEHIELRKEDDGRTEVICKNCGAHLGHVFADGPTETGKRYCINSVCLSFTEETQENT